LIGRELTVLLALGIGVIDDEFLSSAARPGDDLTFPSALHGIQHRGLHLEIPGPVHLARLQHRPGGAGRITTTLQGDLIEERFASLVIVRIALVRNELTRLEIRHLVWPGTD